MNIFIDGICRISESHTFHKTGLLFIYSRLGQRQEAIESYEQACMLTNYKDHIYISALATAYAECKNFNKAIEYQRKAIELSDDQTKEEYKKRIEAYKAHKPWRE